MLLVMCALILSAQDSADLYVNGTVKDYFSRKKISGVKVKVLQDGQNFESLVTSSNGKYEFFLPLDHDYQIIFEKDGMVTKRIAIDSRGIPEEDRRGGFAMNPDMSLFDNIDGIDFSMLDQPIGKGNVPMMRLPRKQTKKLKHWRNWKRTLPSSWLMVGMR
jgi:hypothetical protein